MRLTKQDWIDRFSPQETNRILDAAKVNVDVEAYLFRFNNLTPDADGASIDTQDPRTIYAAHALEAAGLLDSGRTAADLLREATVGGEVQPVTVIAQGTPAPDTDLVTLSAGTYAADDLVECARASDPSVSICAYPARIVAPGAFQ